MDDLKILLVDDSKTMRGLITRQLHLAGFKQVDEAEDAMAAIKKLESGGYDLVLSDWNMPSISGLDMVKMIRAREEFQDLPIMMVTTRKEKEDVLAAMEARINGYLSKPFGPHDLRQKIGEAMGWKEARAEKGSGEAPTAMDVRAQLKDMSDVPALSATVHRIMDMISQEDAKVNLDKLAEALQADPGLSMRVMRIAQSAFFGFTGDYVKTALTYLGVSEVRKIVQSATILEAFGEKEDRSKGLDLKAFWTHSLACGIVMQMISKDSRQPRLFMTGLLHDVGKLVLDLKFPDAYEEILEKASGEERPLHAIEYETLGITHAEVGRELVLNWQLPSELAEIIVSHHAPSQGVRNKHVSSMAYLADIAVRIMGIGDSGNPADPVIVDPYARKIGVSVAGVLEKKDEVLKQVKALRG